MGTRVSCPLFALCASCFGAPPHDDHHQCHTSNPLAVSVNPRTADCAVPESTMSERPSDQSHGLVEGDAQSPTVFSLTHIVVHFGESPPHAGTAPDATVSVQAINDGTWIDPRSPFQAIVHSLTLNDQSRDDATRHLTVETVSSPVISRIVALNPLAGRPASVGSTTTQWSGGSWTMSSPSDGVIGVAAPSILHPIPRNTPGWAHEHFMLPANRSEHTPLAVIIPSFSTSTAAHPVEAARHDPALSDGGTPDGPHVPLGLATVVHAALSSVIVNDLSLTKSADASERPAPCEFKPVESFSSEATPSRSSICFTKSVNRTTVSINDYTLLKELRSGISGKGKVMFAVHSTGELRAIKIVKRSENLQVLKEAGIMERLCHENIVQLFEVIDDPDCDEVYLVMQYAELGVVSPVWATDHPKSDGVEGALGGKGRERGVEEPYCTPLPPKEGVEVVRQTIAGLIHMHERRIFHFNVKPQNLLRIKNGTVVIADFSVSEFMEPHSDSTNVRRSSCGTPAFMAPEVTLEHEFVNGEAVDTWALGVTAFVLLFGRLPFRGSSKEELY